MFEYSFVDTSFCLVSDSLLNYEIYKNIFIIDVDLVPEDDRNIYKCRTQPFHLSVAVDKLNYQYVMHPPF